jgi:hypothetical protein
MGQARRKTADLLPVIRQLVPNSPRSKRDIPHSARSLVLSRKPQDPAFHFEMECCRRVRRIWAKTSILAPCGTVSPVTGLQADEHQNAETGTLSALLHGAVADRLPWRCL